MDKSFSKVEVERNDDGSRANINLGLTKTQALTAEFNLDFIKGERQIQDKYFFKLVDLKLCHSS